MDPSKVKDVLSWKTPQNISDIRSFLVWQDTTEDSSKDFLKFPSL
jgi:hypothetical protein